MRKCYPRGFYLRSISDILDESSEGSGSSGSSSSESEDEEEEGEHCVESVNVPLPFVASFK